MKELAEKIHRRQPTVTVLVDKLIGLGYVSKEKSMEDSRVVFVELTEKGRGLEPIFIEVSAKLNSVVYNGFSEEQAVELENTLEKIKRNLLEY